MCQPDYAAVAVLSPLTGKWELMSCDGRVIVFDTARLAWDWLPLLGQGRLYTADERSLSLTFWEVSSALPNRARIVCPYRPDEVMPWKRHLIWSEWFLDCGQTGETVSAREMVRARIGGGYGDDCVHL